MNRLLFFGLAAIMICILHPLTEAAQKASSYVNLGVSYYKTGKYKEAVQQFEKALALNTDYQNIYGLLGSAFFQMGLIDNAIQAYEKQFRLPPRMRILTSTLASPI